MDIQITTQGRKDDAEKLRWDLLPIEEVEKIVDVLTKGAKKYADDNWQLVESPRRRYYAACMRHLCKWKKGEILDPEDGLPHLAHAACNLIFLQWFDRQDDEKGELLWPR